MNKEQQCPRRTANIFFNEQSFRQKYLAGTVFVIIPLMHGSDDSVDHSTDGVCSSILSAPFQGLSTPTEEHCETSIAQYSSVRITLTFSGGNTTCAALLRTEPTHPLVEMCHKCLHLYFITSLLTLMRCRHVLGPRLSHACYKMTEPTK